MPIRPSLQSTINQLVQEFNLIPDDRKHILQDLAGFIQTKVGNGQKTYLNFICTHNSRRSHLAQIWAQAAARYYGVAGVECFSGGTEATAFNPRAVKAMSDAGFDIVKTKDSTNPTYTVSYADDSDPVIAFSKKYDDPLNHNKDFAAIMTCSHADENCPLVFGASKRIAITYDDPKEFDGTPNEADKYSERTRQIGREMLFMFAACYI
jgi:arsenate reductase (thioredoxin)